MNLKTKKQLDIPEMTLKVILYKTPHGKERRKMLIDFLRNNDNIDNFSVNREGCVLTKYDNDIKKLLKKKILLQGRDVLSCRGDFHFSRTFLFLNKKVLND